MIKEDPKTIIRNIIDEFIGRLGFDATVEVESTGDDGSTFLCAVHVTDGQNFLIGQYGMNMAALQHLVRVIARRRLGEKMDIIVDINEYFSAKKEIVEKEAALALDVAIEKNILVTLRPMLPYERKIVHSFLSENARVVTESVGGGHERRVTIRPRPVTE